MFTVNTSRPQQISTSGAWWIFVLIGLLFTLVGGYLIYDGQKTQNWPTAPGVIQDVDSRESYSSDGQETEYDYTVVYSVGGKEYRSSSSSPSYVSNGSSQVVAYNPANPNDVRVGGSSGWFGWIPVVIGIILIVVGIVSKLRRKTTPVVEQPIAQQAPFVPPAQAAPSLPPQQPLPGDQTPPENPFETRQ